LESTVVEGETVSISAPAPTCSPSASRPCPATPRPA
jgi:hypothetical protein